MRVHRGTVKPKQRKNNMKKMIFSVLAGVVAMGAAQAQTVAPTTADKAPHAYIGIGVANAENRVVDAWKSDAKVFAGYQFDQNFGVEAGYTNFGRVGFHYPTLDGGINGSTRGQSAYVAGTYTMPLNDRVAAYGKLGVEYSQRRYSSSVGALGEHDTGLYAGAGLQVKLTGNLALTGEYERYGKKKTLGAKADVFTLGLKYGF
jgi:opacity protein-like surface antigen